jgi:putative ABC transport system permease protein
MIRHLATMIWNRKRANALILTELVVAFLVLAGLGTAGGYYWTNARRPLGFTIDDVWVASIGHGIARRQGVPPEMVQNALTTCDRILENAKALPQVEAATGVVSGPYMDGMRNTWKSDGEDIPKLGRDLMFDVDNTTDDFARVFGLQLIAGRWYGREDDGAKYSPMVINETMARDFFGQASPLGQQVGTMEGGTPIRVVGVVAGYRNKGKLAPPLRYAFRRYRSSYENEVPYQKLFVKVHPGTGADFEGVLEKRLRATAGPEWSFSVRRLTDVRDASQRLELTPLAAAAIVASFLMLMVVLGLTGVLWQNVTQRTKEIGLRRAKGATRGNIHTQILGELLVLTTVAVVLGALLVAHVPFLKLVSDLPAPLYLGGAALAALLLFAITTVCGFYPARLAARVQPALALRAD